MRLNKMQMVTCQIVSPREYDTARLIFMVNDCITEFENSCDLKPGTVKFSIASEENERSFTYYLRFRR